jgi:hypothetical protein
VRGRKRKLSPAYAQRIARGLARGLTRAQAGGHPAAGEKYISKRRTRALNEHKLQLVIKEMIEGKSLTAAARNAGLQPETVRRTLGSAKLLRKRGKRWAIRDDIPTRMLLYAEREAKTVIPADAKNRSAVGKFMSAVRVFLRSNDPTGLAPFAGKSVRDISGKQHRFETDPNELYRLASIGTETFEDIYKYIVAE